MTTGEKIQFYRRKTGLSQEELGQKMFVSRQTVSLWEMDRTVPTLENLIRLKEIFSVSLDTLLCDDVTVEETATENLDKDIDAITDVNLDEVNNIDDIFDKRDDTDMAEIRERSIPSNVHVFKYDKKELKKIFKKLCARMWIAFIILTVAFGFALAMLFGTEGAELVFSFVSGMIFFSFLYFIKAFLSYRKVWNKNAEQMVQSVYSYQVFDGYFVLNIFREQDIKKWFKISFDEIEAVQNIGEYFVLTVAGQLYIVKKQALPIDSPLLAYCNGFQRKKGKERYVNTKASRRIRAVSISLFVFTILSLFLAVILMTILSSQRPMSTGTEFCWVFFCFTPITIASVIFGFRFRRKKNIIAGIIITVLLCAYGLFVFIPDAYLHTDEPIVRAEQELNIDIPAHDSIDTMVYDDIVEGSDDRIMITSVSDIYFDSNSDSIISFTENISQDTRWIREIPNDMLGVLHYSYEHDTNCYHLIYNKTTKEFNTVPSESGKYEFIHIAYNISGEWMQINEYQVNYFK